ncbi:DUF6084 family protein [Mycolicibacterium goodii]|uniref:Uncharacterized protein n=1 Tax=Mycolicibacterium goodii TaxID=134601 RepID=A0A0K0XGX0_MYCGD|nr:hypothetical protein AFA91_25915 [Mycolicibacterium goodii]
MHADTAVTFAVLDIAPEPYAVTPILTARLNVTASGADPVHAIALRCQVRIDPLRRAYTDSEAAGLLDLFGPRERWSTTQHTFLWQHCTAMVPGFAEATEIDLALNCTFDFEVAASKYLHALQGGTVPLQFLFSGTVFTRGPQGFAVQQIPWDRDDHVDMPVAVWQLLMERHFPHTGWLRLDRDTLGRLAAYKTRRGLLSFDEAVDTLLQRENLP